MTQHHSSRRRFQFRLLTAMLITIPIGLGLAAVRYSMRRTAFSEYIFDEYGAVAIVSSAGNVSGLRFRQPTTPVELRRAVEDFPKLVYVRSQFFDDGHLRELRQMAHLQTLDVSHATRVTDNGVACLVGLLGITEVDLSDTTITNTGLRYLLHLTHLRRLALGGTAVTDAGIADLLALEELRSLSLGSTRITDVSVDTLTMMQLVYLDIRYTKISRQGVERLRAALPNCRILAE